MSFSVKVEEDLPRSAIDLLPEQGYETLGVIDQEMSGWKDESIWNAIQQEKRFFVTADKGFADIRLHPIGQHAGLLLLRPDEDGIRPLLELLRQALKSCRLEELSGTIAVVTPRGLRVRRQKA